MICSPLFVASLYLLCLPCTICEECYRLSKSSYTSCGDTDGTCSCCRCINHTSVDAPTSTPQILVSKIIADDHTPGPACAPTPIISTPAISSRSTSTSSSVFSSTSPTPGMSLSAPSQASFQAPSTNPQAPPQSAVIPTWHRQSIHGREIANEPL